MSQSNQISERLFVINKYIISINTSHSFKYLCVHKVHCNYLKKSNIQYKKDKQGNKCTCLELSDIIKG